MFLPGRWRSNPDVVGIKRLSPDAVIPKQKPGDVGWDLTCIKEVVLPAGHPIRVKTGLSLQMPTAHAKGQPFFARIEGRSGLASLGIFPIGGIIDPGYRGEIEVVMMNIAARPAYTINKGDRFAQIIFYRALMADHGLLLDEVDELDQTERGKDGFGSSGR